MIFADKLMDFVHADNGTAVQLLVNEQYGEN